MVKQAVISIRPWSVLWLLPLVFISFSACKTQKQGTGDLKKKSATALLKKLKSNQIDFEWFTTKANVRYQDKYTNQSFSSTIKVRKDSLIWLNVKKLGIEGGRALITPDSIFIINRLQREYYARDFGYLKRKYNIDVDFNTLQQLIVGNSIYHDLGKPKSAIAPPSYRLTTADDDMRNTYLLEPTTFLLQQMLLEDMTHGRTIKMDFGSYKNQGSKSIACARNIEMTSEETGAVKVSMSYSKIELNVPKTTPFSVSPRYRAL